MPGSRRPGGLAVQRSGIALLITSMGILVFGPMIGLAVDVGILYLLKARLSQAADAACLAGARSLSRDNDVNAQSATAIAVAAKFFDANFPQGYFGTRNLNRVPTVDQSTARLRIVRMTVQLEAPLYFLRLLNHEWASLQVTAEAHRRDVNVIMALGHTAACSDLQNAASAFADRFANGRDRVGLVSFNGGSVLDYAPNLYFKDSPAIATKLSALTCGGRWNGTSQALWMAYQELVKLGGQGALNVILLFADGRPSAITARYAIRWDHDYRFGDGYDPIPNTSTEYNLGPSSCVDNKNGHTYLHLPWGPDPKLGVLAAATFDSRGDTFGLYKYNSANDEQITDYDANGGCGFNDSTYGGPKSVRRDIRYVPAFDEFGNATINELYKSTERFPATDPSGNPHPYGGQIRPDSPFALRNAAYNATDSAAARIRADRNLDVTIYAIGAGANGEPPDDVLMKRIANTGDQVQDQDRPRGLYVRPAGGTQFMDAFLHVASEMLRLAL